MKKVFTILIAAFFLASGMHVSVDRHYCGGKLADVRISVTGKMASCGMEQPETSCPDHQVINNKCCEDQVSFISIGSNYFPEYFKLSHPATERVLTCIHSDNLYNVTTYRSDLISWVIPPGDNLISGVTQSEICVFRI